MQSCVGGVGVAGKQGLAAFAAWQAAGDRGEARSNSYRFAVSRL